MTNAIFTVGLSLILTCSMIYIICFSELIYQTGVIFDGNYSYGKMKNLNKFHYLLYKYTDLSMIAGVLFMAWYIGLII